MRGAGAEQGFAGGAIGSSGLSEAQRGFLLSWNSKLSFYVMSRR
jgi:hypothetical protein